MVSLITQSTLTLSLPIIITAQTVGRRTVSRTEERNMELPTSPDRPPDQAGCRLRLNTKDDACPLCNAKSPPAPAFQSYTAREPCLHASQGLLQGLMGAVLTYLARTHGEAQPGLGHHEDNHSDTNMLTVFKCPSVMLSLTPVQWRAFRSLSESCSCLHLCKLLWPCIVSHMD